MCDAKNLTPELVIAKAAEIVAELQRVRTKLTTTCDTLHNCESELMATRTTACAEKQRLQQQIESLQAHAQDMEARCRQAERDLQSTRDRLTESEGNGDKLREELRGFESRCCRLQNTIDRFQNDRLQYLRNLASIVSVPEPCETMIKDKVRDIVTNQQSLQTVCIRSHDNAQNRIFTIIFYSRQQLNNLREQSGNEASRHREICESTTQRLRNEEIQKATIEERFEKASHELNHLRSEHVAVRESCNSLTH